MIKAYNEWPILCIAMLNILKTLMQSFGIQSHLILWVDLWWYIIPIANDVSHTCLHFLEGYSVGAGHFWSRHTTEVVGGAPQHEQIGKVRYTFVYLLHLFISSIFICIFTKVWTDCMRDKTLKEELQKF